MRNLSHIKPTLILLFAAALGSTVAAQVPAEYDLNLSVRPRDTLVVGSGTVTYTVTRASGESAQVLLNKTMGDFHLEIVEPTAIAGPAKVEIQEQDNGQTSYFVKYPQRLNPGSRVTLRYSYRGGKLQGQQYSLDSSFLFAGGVATAWYPQLVETVPPGSGQLTDGVGTIRVTVPAPFVAAMTCARTTAEGGGDSSRYTFSVTEPTYFALFVGKYRSQTLAGKLPITAYLTGDHPGIERYLRGCSDIIAALSDEFGPYPYSDFTLVEFPNSVSEKLGIGGGSLAGGIMMPTNSLNAKFNLALFGHELAHQWWGNLIRNSGEMGNGMLDEAMAQYGSLLIVERMDGLEGAETYRRRGYPGYISNQSGIGYLKVAAMGKDEPLSHLSSQSIHVIDDSKGFLVYNVLRNTLGKDNTRKILKQIISEHAHGFITWQGFLDAIEKGSKRDLKWFYAQWFDRTGVPEWQLEWRQSGHAVNGTIRQIGPVYRLNLDLAISGSAGQELARSVEIRDSVTTFAFDVPFDVDAVTLDPHFEVPHWDSDYKVEAYALIAPTTMTGLRVAKKFDEAKALYAKTLAEIPEPDTYGVRFRMEYEIGRVLMMEDKPAEALPHFLEAVRAPSRSDELLAWAYLRVAQMAALVHDTATCEWAVKATISADAMLGGNTGARGIAVGLIAKP